MEKAWFGELLRQLREERGLSMGELAQRSGIHPSTISRLESDRYRKPHMDTFVQLARGFGLSVQELAILTELIDPVQEKSLIICDENILANYHLLTPENMRLLCGVAELAPHSKYHLAQFLASCTSEAPHTGS